MQIHELKRQNKNKKDRIVGRGGKHAKTSGRGGKGQTARAGNKRRPELRVIIKKIPKLRGYRFNSIQNKPVSVSLDKIAKLMQNGADINPKSLVEAKVIKTRKGVIPKVKILAGKNEFNLKANFSNLFISESALTQITKAGGKIEK